MTFHVQICHDACGGWSVRGLSPKPARHLASLSASIDYVRRQCGAAPAVIELMIDDFYAVVHQEDGWPRQLVAPEARRPGEGSGGDEGDRTSLERLRDWLSGRR